MIDFDSLRNFYLVDLNGIIFLLRFLEQHLSEDSETTNGLLSTLLIIIRTNGAIKNKVADCINGTPITIENMEQIGLITRSTSKWEIFQYFNQETYLQGSLLKATPSAYLIKWAQCFLAKTQLTNDIEKKKSKKLLEKYMDRLKNDQPSLVDVLRNIDEILNSFEDSVDHAWLRREFINRIICLCFGQGISRNIGSKFFDIFLFRSNSFDDY